MVTQEAITADLLIRALDQPLPQQTVEVVLAIATAIQTITIVTIREGTQIAITTIDHTTLIHQIATTVVLILLAVLEATTTIAAQEAIITAAVLEVITTAEVAQEAAIAAVVVVLQEAVTVAEEVAEAVVVLADNYINLVDHTYVYK